MKKILIIIGIIFLNGYAYSNSPGSFVDYPSVYLAEQEFEIGDFKFNLPDGYTTRWNDDAYEGVYYDSLIYETITNITDNSQFSDLNNETNITWITAVGVLSEVETAYSNLISSGSFQLQDLEIIDNELLLIAQQNEEFFGPERFTEKYQTNDLFITDGVIVKSFYYPPDSFGSGPVYEGTYFLAMDNSQIFSFYSDFDPTLKYKKPNSFIDNAMNMYKRIYSSNPIPKYVGVTNSFGFSRNNINWENISPDSSIISNLNNQISLLESEINTLSSMTNNQDNASEQLALINNIVNVYQSQINSLEEERSSLITTNEALNMMRDLRVGSQTFSVDNGNAKIRMYVDESGNLTDWTNTPHVLELDIPADTDTKFFRFRMD